jgi:hypothetical protein
MGRFTKFKRNAVQKIDKGYTIYSSLAKDSRVIVRKPAFDFNQRDMNPALEDYVTRKYKQ